jgi:hypothetical protein
MNANKVFHADLNGGDRFVMKDGVCFDLLLGALVAPSNVPKNFHEKAVEALNNSVYNKENKSAVSMAFLSCGEAAFFGRSDKLPFVTFGFKPEKGMRRE